MTKAQPLLWGGSSAACLLLTLLFLACTAASPAAEAATPAGAITLKAVPTFVSCGLYLEGAPELQAVIRPQYRVAGAAAWQEGWPLFADAKEKQFRGSLVDLQADTPYEVRCVDAQDKPLAAGTFRTWSENPPVAKTIDLAQLNPGGGPLTITEAGTPEGWIRYTAPEGYVLQGGTEAEQALLLDKARYILLDNLHIVGGKRHGIRLLNTAAVRVRGCDISGFGRVGVQDLQKDGKFYLEGQKQAVNWDAGVYLDLALQTVIERCYIHDPRNTANSWLYSHPAGPNAVFVRAKGQTVIRYNDFPGSNQHRWNDVIEGYGNGNTDGGFNADADIYGNYLAYCNDDGIELDGGQCNVRFFGNKVEGGLCGISTAPNRRGPCYIFRNLVVNLGDDRGVASAGIKNGGGAAISTGRTCFFNNVFFTNGRGIAGVGFGNGKDRENFLATTRNNILATTSSGASVDNGLPGSDFNHDFFTTPDGQTVTLPAQDGQEAQAATGNPGFIAPLRGDYRLRDNSPARTTGGALPGFTPADSKEPGIFASANGKPGNGQAAGMIPQRPLPADADRLQMIVESGKPAEALVLRSTSQTAQTFQVLRNGAFDWLQVTPAQGSLPAGGTLTLQIAVAPGAQLPQGLTPGALSVRFADGTLLPVSVYARHDPAGFCQRYEAEKLPGAQDFKTVDDAEAGDGKALEFAAAEPRKIGKKFVTIEADLPADGLYFLSYRVWCPQPLGNHDSIFVGINGGEPKTTGVLPAERWHWVDYSGGILQLAKGTNSIILMPREDIRLDAVILTSRRLLPGEPLPSAAPAAQR